MRDVSRRDFWHADGQCWACRVIAGAAAGPDDLAAPVLTITARVARAAKQAFVADGITLRQNNEAASDQHLFHFHLHVIPRFDGDAARFAATPALASHADQENAAARLRAALATAPG